MSSLFPEFYDRVLARLVEARKRAKVTQVTLAAKLGRPQTFVSKYETRERMLDFAEYVMIARFLGVIPYRMLRSTEDEIDLGPR